MCRNISVHSYRFLTSACSPNPPHRRCCALNPPLPDSSSTICAAPTTFSLPPSPFPYISLVSTSPIRSSSNICAMATTEKANGSVRDCAGGPGPKLSDSSVHFSCVHGRAFCARTAVLQASPDKTGNERHLTLYNEKVASGDKIDQVVVRTVCIKKESKNVPYVYTFSSKHDVPRLSG